MTLPFQLVRNNAFSKLKKAIDQKDMVKMVLSMLNLTKIKSKKVKTRGENIEKEVNRALRHLKRSKDAKVKAALEIAKSKLGDQWNTEVNVSKDKTPETA